MKQLAIRLVKQLAIPLACPKDGNQVAGYKHGETCAESLVMMRRYAH
jgi:hypothetical protein